MKFQIKVSHQVSGGVSDGAVSGGGECCGAVVDATRLGVGGLQVDPQAEADDDDEYRAGADGGVCGGECLGTLLVSSDGSGALVTAAEPGQSQGRRTHGTGMLQGSGGGVVRRCAGSPAATPRRRN